MPYKDGQAEKVGDKVLGQKVKGRVAAVLAGDKIIVVSKGPWNPKGPDTELRKEYPSADLILVSRAPEIRKK